MTARDASSPRPRNPRGAGGRLHGELVDAAVRVLATHGDTERLSIRAVAAEAQVTPPAVYRCFPDRRALVRTTVQTCFDRFETQLAQAEQGTADPFEALRRRCRAYADVGTAQPHLYRVMFGAWSAGPKELGTYGRGPHPGAAAFTELMASIQRCLNAAPGPDWRPVSDPGPASRDTRLVSLCVSQHLEIAGFRLIPGASSRHDRGLDAPQCLLAWHGQVDPMIRMKSLTVH
jgi:AcrR family transcriptional regulator